MQDIDVYEIGNESNTAQYVWPRSYFICSYRCKKHASHVSILEFIYILMRFASELFINLCIFFFMVLQQFPEHSAKAGTSLEKDLVKKHDELFILVYNVQDKNILHAVHFHQLEVCSSRLGQYFLGYSISLMYLFIYLFIYLCSFEINGLGYY